MSLISLRSSVSAGSIDRLRLQLYPSPSLLLLSKVLWTLDDASRTLLSTHFQMSSLQLQCFCVAARCCCNGLPRWPGSDFTTSFLCALCVLRSQTSFISIKYHHHGTNTAVHECRILSSRVWPQPNSVAVPCMSSAQHRQHRHHCMFHQIKATTSRQASHSGTRTQVFSVPHLHADLSILQHHSVLRLAPRPARAAGVSVLFGQRRTVHNKSIFQNEETTTNNTFDDSSRVGNKSIYGRQKVM